MESALSIYIVILFKNIRTGNRRIIIFEDWVPADGIYTAGRTIPPFTRLI